MHVRVEKIAFFFYLQLYVVCALGSNKTDSVIYTRGYFGGNISISMRQMDYSGLRKYTYLLNEPPNYAGGLDIMLYGGLPDKIFATFSFNRLFQFVVPSSTYNNYGLSVQYGYIAFGISATAQLYQNLNNKALKRIYFSLGAQSVSVNISSEATGNGKTTSDTSFYYEDSEVKKVLLNAEIMLDLFSLGKKNKESANNCITLKAGYSFQIGNPIWSGTYSRLPGDDNPKINLGGFYFLVGLNIWSRKQKK